MNKPSTSSKTGDVPPASDTASTDRDPASRTPDWYPDWARELADLYFSETTCLFLLHGNVHDLVASPSGDETHYGSLSEFLATQVFGSWEAVLHHDLGQGIRPLAGPDSNRHANMVRALSGVLGAPARWPSEPNALFHWLGQFLERNLLHTERQRISNVALIFEYAQYLVPEGDVASLARGGASRLVRLLGWSQNP
ncbi:MAG: hypothetical protein N2C14_18545, partial [Planctomycetales bacterium]